MGLKDFNYKQFFFDHGERIGLAAAGLITLLLVLTLVMPGMGFMSPSADVNTTALSNNAKTVETGLTSNTPTDADKPSDPKQKQVAFNFDILSDAKAEEYRVASLFDGRKPGRVERGMPELLQPTESKVAVVRFQLPSLVFDKDLKYLETLKGATNSTGAGAGAMPSPAGSGSPDPGAVGNFLNKGGSGFGLEKNLATPNAQRFNAGGLIMDRKGGAPEKAEKDYETAWIEVSKLSKDLGGAKLAEQTYPVRAAEIVAAFPYKEQVEEFRQKLGLPSDVAVLSEPSLETTKEGKPLAAFRFLGVKVERRLLNAESKPIDVQGRPIGDKEGWVPLDLEGSYKPLMILNGKRLEPEDPKLQPIIFPGLVMKKLVTMGARRATPLNEYPDIEDEVPGIKSTLETLNKQPDAPLARPSLTNDPGNIFDQPTGPTGANGAPLPGGSTGAGAPPIPGGSAVPGGSAMPAGSSAPGMPYSIPVYGQDDSKVAIPDDCLIRLFDVTIEPGKTYQYRMQVSMANPNYGRKDLASQNYASNPELPANDRWFVLKDPVSVPPELYYYAVDQKELDAKDPQKDKTDPREPKLPAQAVKEGQQTTLQIHRWMDFIPTKNRGPSVAVGDWVIAERVVATKGEPIGRQRVEVPYWRMPQDRFTMYFDAPPKSNDPRKQLATVEAPFAPEGEEPILVDFTSADLTYKRVHPKTDDAAATDQPLLVQDKAPVEVLLVTADGKLLAHNSATDAADKDRKDRLKAVRDWIHEVKYQGEGGKPNTNPFP